MLAAVWPNLVVTDDTLVQSIGELRRALGESGARLITTVPRRGYRFEGDEAPPDRRKARGWHPLRWRWKYGILAPLAVAHHGRGAVAGPTVRDAMKPPASTSPIKPAIAVLPFQNQGDDASREYLADGLTQDLINSLGRFSALTVMSWNAVAAYKGAAVRPGEIARVLAVRYQVEGSVRYAADQRARQRAARRRPGPRLVVGALRRSARRPVRAAGSHHARDRRRARDPRHRVRAATRGRETHGQLRCVRLRAARAARAAAADARRHRRGARAAAPRHRARPRHTPPRIRRSAKPSTWRSRWAGRSRPTNTGSASKPRRTRRCALDAARRARRASCSRACYIAYNRYAEAQAQIDRAIAINPERRRRARGARQHPRCGWARPTRPSRRWSSRSASIPSSTTSTASR